MYKRISLRPLAIVIPALALLAFLFGLFLHALVVHAQTTLIYSFGAFPGDARRPGSSLILSGNTLYGTTSAGGVHGDASVFSIDTDGSNYQILHSFDLSNDDGAYTESPLTLVGTTLYGFAGGGGLNGDGIIYSLNTDGTDYQILHTFGLIPNDGAWPSGAPLIVGNTIYGVTDLGGDNFDGTIFSINTDGTNYQVLHTFGNVPNDGSSPYSSTLTLVDNVLYGVTNRGGASNDGIIFSINPDGSNYQILYTCGTVLNDCAGPFGRLLPIETTLYGMTVDGGAYGYGNIFSIETDGSSFASLYSFGTNLDDGWWPDGSLTLVDDTLYGVTYAGGGTPGSGYGTMFSIRTNGTNYQKLHSFAGGPSDGRNPYLTSLTLLDDTFYSVTLDGGANNSGVVYSFPLPGPIEISSCAEFEAIGDNLTADYVLTQDIDCSGYLNFIPIGFDVVAKTRTPFTSSLDGAGYTISNLHMDGESFSLFFGVADYEINNYYAPFTFADSARFENLTLLDGSVSGFGETGAAGLVAFGESVSFENLHIENYVVLNSNPVWWASVGGILGEASIGATFDTVSFSGDITSGSPAGGIVGLMNNANGNSSINNATTSGSITTTDFGAGGILGNGYSDASVNPIAITNSSSSMDIFSIQNTFAAGGLVGYGTEISIRDSFATGNVSCGLCVGAYAFGGLVGYSGEIELTNVYATGNVTVGVSADAIGGLVGTVDWGPSPFFNTYSSGDVIVGDYAEYVGGLVGAVFGAVQNTVIENSFSNSAITVGNESASVGGLVGTVYMSLVITSSYSDGPVTVGADSYYIGGLVGDMYGWDVVVDGTFSNSLLTVGDRSYYVGGLVGSLWSGLISNSYSTQDIVLNALNKEVFPVQFYQLGYEAGIGSLVGNSEEGVITNSYSTANVTVTSSDPVGIGTLLGHVYGFNTTVNVSGTFTANSVSPTIPDISQYGEVMAGIGGSGYVGTVGYYGTLIGSENYYDETIAGPLTCANGYDYEPGNPPAFYAIVPTPADTSAFSCSPVTDSTAFYSVANAPLTLWDFDDIWEENECGYPTLRFTDVDDLVNGGCTPEPEPEPEPEEETGGGTPGQFAPVPPQEPEEETEETIIPVTPTEPEAPFIPPVEEPIPPTEPPLTTEPEEETEETTIPVTPTEPTSPQTPEPVTTEPEEVTTLMESLIEVLSSIKPSHLTLLATVGAFTGAASFIGMAFLTPLHITELALLPSRLWALLLAALGFRRKRLPWGTVYDSVTKQPLDPAYVQLLEKGTEKEADTAFTDLDGRFGFLPKSGSYTMKARKTNYAFPSKRLIGNTSDALYDNLYFGEALNINSENDAVIRNIPLDPVGVDWNEVQKRKGNMFNFYSKYDVIFYTLTSILFYLGLGVSIAAAFFFPSLTHTVILIIYALITILRTITGSPKRLGRVFDSNGEPLAYAAVRVYLANTENQVKQVVTNQFGRFYCLVVPATYYVKVFKRIGAEDFQEIYTSPNFYAKDGLVDGEFGR